MNVLKYKFSAVIIKYNKRTGKYYSRTLVHTHTHISGLVNERDRNYNDYGIRTDNYTLHVPRKYKIYIMNTTYP